MAPTADDIYACLAAIVPAAALPRIELSGADRMALSGSTSRAAPRLVAAVCRALRDEPDLFVGLPVDPGALAARQERALAYFCLFGALQRLALRARDCYLVEQAGAAAEATALVQHGRHQRKGPFPTRLARRMEDALRPAERVLAAEKRRKGPAVPRSEGRRKGPAPRRPRPTPAPLRP